jgi:hypothetical protein
MNLSKTYKTIIIIIALFFGSIIGKASIEYFYSKSVSIDDKLVFMANEINKKAPIVVDKDTRFDNVNALLDKTVQFNFTLINYLKKDIDIKQLKINLRLPILNAIKTNPDLKLFTDNKVTMEYVYRDKVGVFLFKLQFKHDDYKTKIQ